MTCRLAVVAAILLAGLTPINGEATTRLSFSIAKSFHPESDRDYTTVHPGFGATGPLVGEWLRWRTGLVRHSHSRWGPYPGVAATWQVTRSWRLGLSAGIVGNYRLRSHANRSSRGVSATYFPTNGKRRTSNRYECGFADNSHLLQWFKREFGMPAQQHRPMRAAEARQG